MAEIPAMKAIATIQSDFATKFGIPRQSGLVDALKSTIVFAPEFRNPDALRGLDGFSHLWLVWVFSESVRTGWSPTVRPPRLGGNARMGVFATRSPFRPNPVGLSSVKLDRIEMHPDLGPILHISGADLMNGTPILDIKPYIPYADSHPDAVGGFANTASGPTLTVDLPEHLRACVPPDRLEALLGVLAHDPRPPYQNDPSRVYGFSFAGCNIKFTVRESILTVQEITPDSSTKSPVSP